MKGLVVLSGGQDSTTCLGIALNECEEVEAITFNYGQKHAIELVAAKRIADRHDVHLTRIDLRPVLEHMKSSALITHSDTTEKHTILKDLPASFVPARNALFLTAAYGLAIEHKCDTIYTGVCQTDYSGYPDCRDEFIKSLNATLNLGYQSDITIKTPLMWLTKADTFQLADEMGVLGDVLQYSATCYEGDMEHLHAWGYGCDECPACKLRAAGWATYIANRDLPTKPMEMLSDEIRNAH